METVQGNKLIHDWMGNKRMKEPFAHWWIGAVKPEDLKYHTSWDWLMPVVEKIQKWHDNEADKYFPLIIEEEQDPLYVLDLKIGAAMDEVYYGVLHFLGWYNKQGREIMPNGSEGVD